ncbi:MAG: glycosyltransferase family 4 protein [Weeksellaceae bacterium]
MNLNKIKVCHLSSMHRPDDRIYQRACLGLKREGLEVHLVITLPDELPKNEGVHFHWLKKRTGWKRRWFSSKEAVDKAIEVNADIYHFHDPDLLPHILKIKKKRPNAKIVYDMHENFKARFKQWGLPAFLEDWFHKYQLNKINRMDGYATTTESMKVLFKEVKKPGVVIRNAVDVNRLSHIDIESVQAFNTPTIYTSGANSHARLVLQTVQSMKHLPKELNFQMMFAGRYLPGIREELMAQAQKDGTDNYLQLEDMLPWDENFKRTAKALCGCVFYENNANNQVTLPNRVYEYMFSGIPIVVSDFPELRKIVEKAQCGVIVSSDKPEEMAQAFEYLLRNPEEAKKMGENGRKAIFKDFGYHIDLKNTIDFYHKILND